MLPVTSNPNKQQQQQSINVNTKLSEESKQAMSSLTVQAQGTNTLQRINKFASVKPPPPSTKIPRSAVVMPGNNQSGFKLLDVQFGVDIDTSSMLKGKS